MDDAEITVVMAAHDASGTIGEAVSSLLAQEFARWRLVIAADDGQDYAALLGRAGLADPRIAVIATEKPRSGASAARNCALDEVRSRYCAVLDADDRFGPGKLVSVMAALGHHAIVSTGLKVISHNGEALRQVGTGPDRELDAAEHKWVNLSMDSMIAWDTERAKARYEPGLPNMNDLDFLLRLFGSGEKSWHLGRPLHDYRKSRLSLSNGAGVTERMVAAKSLLLDRLGTGYYGLAEDQADGVAEFLRISLAAERTYGEQLAENPGLLFEDHLEPLLRAASTSRA